MKNENSPIYILKGICAILVVLIHTDFLSKQLWTPIYRIAVPIFYMISGYYLLSKEYSINQDTIKKQLKKIIKYTITASFVYILFNIGFNIFKHIHENTQFNLLNILLPHTKNIFETTLRYLLSNPYSEHLWYLTAYIGCLICLLYIVKFKLYNLLLYLVPIGLLVGLSIGKYSFWEIHIPAYLYRNVFTTALPFVLIGLYIRKYQESILLRSKNLNIIILVFVILSYIEYLLYWKLHTYKGGDLMLTTIPTAIIFFLYFRQKKPTWGKRNIIKIIGKDYSLNIYLYHILFVNIFRIFFNKKDYPLLYQFEFPIVLLFTVAIFFIYHRINITITQKKQF